MIDPNTNLIQPVNQSPMGQQPIKSAIPPKDLVKKVFGIKEDKKPSPIFNPAQPIKPPEPKNELSDDDLMVLAQKLYNPDNSAMQNLKTPPKQIAQQGVAGAMPMGNWGSPANEKVL